MKLNVMLVLCVVTIWVGRAIAVEIHVAPDGDVATLDAARDRARQARQAGGFSGPITIIVHGGTYRLTQPFRLRKEDSGTHAAPLTIRAADGQSPHFIGGAVVGGFKSLGDDPVAARLSESARLHVRVADLKALGIAEYGKLSPIGFGRGAEPWMELFFNGRPMRLAQYPNTGWLTIDRPITGRASETFVYRGDRPAQWAREPDPWIYGYWHHGWADQFLPIQSIDASGRTITTGARHEYGVRAGARYLGTNLLCELDSPGEYFIDRSAGRLYFWPPSPIKSGQAIVSQLTGAMIDVNQAAYIRIEGLTLEVARASGVAVRQGEQVTIARCVIRNLGDTGVSIAGGIGHRVVNCEIVDTGGAGIVMSGGDRATLSPSGHQAVSNTIHHVGRLRRTYTPGVSIGGVGQRVAHNLIRDSPHAAILYGGNDHLIEYNDIHHVLLETDDAGAIYIGRDWTARGHILRYNYIHHSGPEWASPVPQDQRTEPHVVYEPRHLHGANLVYHDDAASGITVLGNILHGGDRGMLLGGGRDNVTRNNIFIASKMGVWIDARGLGWAKDHIRRGGAWAMYKKLEAVRHDQPPYSTRYPALANILSRNPPAPEGNVVERNIFIGVKQWLALQGPKSSDIQLADNLHDLAVEYDPAHPINVLKSLDPQALKKIGFASIPIQDIGPRPIGIPATESGAESGSGK